MEWSKMIQCVETMMSPKRWRHTLGVMQTVAVLASVYSVDADKARLAALLHDCTREWPGGQLLKKAGDFAIVVTDVDRIQPDLLHGPVAAAIAVEDFGVCDLDVLEAIRWHTTGQPFLGKLAKIVFVADSLEPGRTYPGVAALRTQMDNGLDELCLAVMNHTLTYLLTTDKLIHPASVEARNRLLVDMGERKSV